MELLGTNEEILSWIGELTRASTDIDETRARYSFDRHDNFETSIEIEQLETLRLELKEFNLIEETSLVSTFEYETLIREEGGFYPFRIRNRSAPMILEDSENGIEYRLSRASNRYLVFLIDKASELGNVRSLSRPMPIGRILENCTDEGLVGLDVVNHFLPRCMTLQIKSKKRLTHTDYEKYTSAFLFNISYNTDFALVQQRNFDEILRAGRITRTRRANIEDLDAPRRHYIPDLIHHYQLAVGTDNPMLEFISYYHILEYFFESVFQDDLIESVRTKITHVDFSYKRKNDISALIKQISKSVQLRSENVTFSEQEALRLTIKKYCNIQLLIESLSDYDSSLLEYYKNNTVNFSAGDSIDLTTADENIVFKKLAMRIYKTRNAVVHSKDSDKRRYTPFRDDKHLVKEVPLLRFIAEQIIFESSNIVS